MDSTRFDNLTKALATAPTRRKAIGAIIATIGGALGLDGLSTSFAKKCQHAGDHCHVNTDCCSHLCCHGVCCGQGHICHNGKCVKRTTTTVRPTTTTAAPATTTAAPASTIGNLLELLFHSFNT